MAVYGLSGDGKVPFTGYTNTLGTANAVTGVTSGYAQFNGINQNDDRLAKLLRRGSHGRVLRALWRALTGAAAGGTATQTRARVQATQGGNLNGLIPIETVNMVNRATTSADQTAITALLDRVDYPSTYVADLSGNGGGGKGSY